MPDIRADGVAVYAYRRAPGRIEFLQIRRASGEYAQTWQAVYGGVERLRDGKWAETAVQAALRELREETGLVPVRMFQVEYVEQFYFRPKDYVCVMPVFAAEVAVDAVVKLNDEHDSQRWVPEQQVETMFMWRSQREALREIIRTLQQGSAGLGYLTIDVATP